MKEMPCITPVRLQITTGFGPSAIRIVVVARSGEAGGVNHLSQGAQMVAGVVVTARRGAGHQLRALTEIALLNGRACGIPLLANFHPAPDETPVVHRNSVLLFHDPNPPAK